MVFQPNEEYEDVKQSIAKTNREVRLCKHHCNIQNFS